MKTKFKSRTNLRRVRSYNDLELEKARLKIELIKTEEQIRSNYKHLADQLSIRNLVKRMTDEITMTKNVVSNAISIGKDIFANIKKKKKRWKNRHNPSPAPEDEQVTLQDPASD